MNLHRNKEGLVLVTGPTGSGKSTTLASLINIINKENNKFKIPTLEEITAYCLDRKTKLILNSSLTTTPLMGGEWEERNEGLVKAQ